MATPGEKYLMGIPIGSRNYLPQGVVTTSALLICRVWVVILSLSMASSEWFSMRRLLSRGSLALFSDGQVNSLPIYIYGCSTYNKVGLSHVSCLHHPLAPVDTE